MALHFCSRLLSGASILFLGLLSGRSAPAADPLADGIEFFERRVRPVLVRHCYSCHSADAKKVRGGLRLDTKDSTLAGGAGGAAVVPGDPNISPLVKAIRYADEDLQMPPDGKLSDTEIADLEEWVRIGAPDPRTGGSMVKPNPSELWSLRPVVDPTPPAVRDVTWPLTDIDRFVLAKLEQNGLTPSPPADRQVLLRRVTFDLTGLPPTPEEIDAFLVDGSPDAFAKVVERLLASPAYGERWGRHWLDVVRYSDTAGDNSDYPIPQMYRYRDWVIDSFNQDLPYDEFVRRQLAGDLLPAVDDADRHDKLIATGYLANARRFGSYDDMGTELPYPWHLTIEDTIDNLGRTFLGLTINCCRCHDHKFDPLSQADYYALYGFFQSTRYPWPGIELDQIQRDLIPLVPGEVAAPVLKERTAAMAAYKAWADALSAEKKAAIEAKTKAEALPEGDARKTAVEAAEKRVKALEEAVKEAKKNRAEFEKTPLPFPTAYAVADRTTAERRKPGNAQMHIKGDPQRLGPEVPRRFPSVLGGQLLPPETAGSGRLELARWLTDPKNPLTARVMANRVWHYHFGKGIVPTPGNFGVMGQPPTHPELLDFLTSRFVESGWSVKALHRLVVLSRTYQMAGNTDDPTNVKLDPNNDLLWYFPRRRLDAESVRDAMLSTAGALDRSTAGPHPFPDSTTWNYTQHNPFKAVYETDKRSVYLMTQRIQRHPFLALFDGADPNAATDRRVTSTTSLQALYLMNDPFVHTQASRLAARLLSEGNDDGARVDRAYRLLFGRPPNADETAATLAHLALVREKLSDAPADRKAGLAWESLARALFLTNEFVTLD